MANQGLITLRTDLTSLKYDSIPLGSDKPYITKDIGQAPGSQIGAEISHRIDDVSRIAKMLVDKPGIKYLLHEALLQQVNVADKIKNRGKKTVAQAILKQAGSTLLNTAKVAASTLAQVPVNGTGTHFLRGFRTDTYLQPSGPGNISAFASFFGAGGVEGAPYALRGAVVPGEHKTELTTDTRSSNFDYVGGDVFVDRNESLNIPLPQDADKRQTKENAQSGTPIKVAPTGSGVRETTATPTQLGTVNTTTGNYGPDDLNIVQPTISKYSASGSYLVEKTSVQTLNGNVTKEARVLLGDQGAQSTNQEYNQKKRANKYWFRSDPDPMKAAEVDKLNALPPNTAKNFEDSGKVNGNTNGRDLIKFRFHIITPDQPETVLYFRAYLDSFADNYSAAWNPVKYLGRAEDFQIYGGFQRKLSLSFKIAAATRSEMEPIYQKMIWLASATAPTYAKGGQFMRGTITKITVGDYVYELPGVLNSVNYTWNPDYPWDIAMVEPEKTGADDFEQELPMIMDCSIDFTPIHTFTPTTGLRQYITTHVTERGKKGIKNINNANTGIQPVPVVTAEESAVAPVTVGPQPEPTTNAFGFPLPAKPVQREIPAILQPPPAFGPQQR